MKVAPVRPSSKKRERRSLALVTAAFILASAALHAILGSSVHGRWAKPQAAQSSKPLIVSVLETPRPTPKPTPTPRPTPHEFPRVTPKPEATRVATARPIAKTQPRQPAKLPSSVASPGSGPTLEPALPPESPAPQVLVSPTPYDARDIIISARFVRRADPVYPEMARAEGAEGTVIVLLTIGPDGVPKDVRIWNSSGNAALDRAALEAAERSTYSPPEVNGVPATQTYRIIYTFYLNP